MEGEADFPAPHAGEALGEFGGVKRAQELGVPLRPLQAPVPDGAAPEARLCAAVPGGKELPERKNVDDGRPGEKKEKRGREKIHDAARGAETFDDKTEEKRRGAQREREEALRKARAATEFRAHLGADALEQRAGAQLQELRLVCRAALQSDPRRFLEDGLRNASAPSGKFFERFRGKKLTGGFAVRAKFHGRHAASAVMAEGVPEPGLPDPECRASASGSRTT